MRGWGVFLLLAGTAASAFAVKPVTVAQLEQKVTALHGRPDAKAARQLRDLQLTERLSVSKLAELQSETPGPKTRQALHILADQSAFLNCPPADVPPTPAPDIPTQRRILIQTIHYVIGTVRQLPNFSASRVTARFEDMPLPDMQGQNTAADPLLYPAGISRALVTFRDGQEVVDESRKGEKRQSALDGLTTRGEFGPILFTVLLDITHSSVQWSHWEESSGKTLAVFAFSVPREQSHYQIGACCEPNDPSRAIQQLAGYHGQIAVDPANGKVFRIVVQADLKPTDLITRANILVEYGPIELGGKSYICPLRSVAVLVDKVGAGSAEQEVYGPAFSGETPTPHTQVDEVTFTQYHLFRAESRILP